MAEPKVWKGTKETVHGGVLESVVLTVPRERTEATIEVSVKEQLEAPLKRGEEIGLATVYRVLTQFEDAGLVTRHHFEGGHSVFELSPEAHHDVESGGFLKRLIDALILWFQNLVG